MDESTEGSAVERLFEWLKQKHPDADNEALLDKALANVDAFAQRSGESPEALRTLRAALQSAANRLEFPSRLLRHGSEPVRAADIRVGAVYYDVGYYGSDCLFPCVLPYVFAGFGLSGDGDDLAYFQDINSYAAGVRFGDDRSEEDAEFLCQSHQIGSMYTFDVALEALMKVSLDRDRVMERSYRKLCLTSGTTVEVKTYTYIGREMYELNYFTRLSLDDAPSLRAEMLEVWNHHSRAEEDDKRKFRAVTAHKKPTFVDEVSPNPVRLAFRREGDSWVETAWSYGDDERASVT